MSVLGGFIMKKKILMFVGWNICNVEDDDKKRHPANFVINHEKYWFFKYWKRNDVQVDVMGTNSVAFIEHIEKKWLKFYILKPLYAFFIQKNYDIIICFHSQVAILLALLRSLFWIKYPPLVIIDVEGLGRKNNKIISFFLRKAIIYIDHIFYLSLIQKQDYALYIPEVLDRIQFLTWGVDLSYYEYENIPEENYIVSIGYQDKNFRDWTTLIKAFNLVKNKIKLIVIGKNSFNKNDINTKVDLDNVEFAGHVNVPQLNKLILKSKCVVLPLPERRHAYGQMTLVGCMALKRVVIASCVSGVMDYGKNGESLLFVEPMNAAKLAEKIDYVLDNPERSKSIGIEARKAVEKYYTEELMANTIFDAINKYI